MNSKTGNERGSAAILMCAVIALAIVLMAAVVSVGGAIVLAGRAEAAADAAALAAADTVALGPSRLACAAASLVAEANGARLVDCHVEPRAVEVVVSLAGHGVTSLGRTVRARSRAEVDVSATRGAATG